MKSKVLALSAVSAGFVAISLIIGAYVEFVDLFMLVVSSVFVILPLYYGSFKGSCLSFLAGGVIALLCALPTISFTIVFPAYVAFFGLYPIVRHFMLHKKFNKIAGYIIGMFWCVGSVFGLYFYYTLVIGLPLNDLPYWFVNYIYIFLALIGVIFYIIYDRYVIVIKRFLDRLLYRIIK